MVKKIFMLCAFAILFMAANCDNEPYEGEIIFEDTACIEAIEITSMALGNFLNASEEDYYEFCLDYKEALLNQIEICGDEDGSLQLLSDELDDCYDDDLCAEAIAATEIAEANYNNYTEDDNYQQLCEAYKSALEYQQEVCGESAVLQSLILGLGDCQQEFVETPGDWILVSWITDNLRDIDNDGVVTNNYLDEIDCYTNETMTFNTDGTGAMFLRSYADITFTPNEGGEDFFIDCNTIIEDIAFTWYQEGNSVFITDNEGVTNQYFRNGNSLFVAIDDAFYAQSTVDDSFISERITFVYNKL